MLIKHKREEVIGTLYLKQEILIAMSDQMKSDIVESLKNLDFDSTDGLLLSGFWS